MKKPKSVVKGAPSGFVVSLLIHGAAFLLAGLLVVFTVNQKEEKKFVPPKPVDRPKMKLKKPQVKVKKNAKPKSSTRIVTKVSRPNMPDIQLPEMSGMGDGLAGGMGGVGFELTPDLSELTIFGGGQSIGNDFVGTLYDFKRTRSGGPTGIDPDGFLAALGKFTRGGWSSHHLSKYYQAPKKLYTTHFMIPTISSDIAPTAFGEPDMIGYAWAVHYKGQIVHPTGGRFRFWAQGDDIIIVRLNGEIVVDGSVSDGGGGSFREILTDYVNVTADSMKYYLGERRAEVGKWFTIEPGVPMTMEVVIGEVPGGSFSAMLCVEEEGAEYPKSSQGGPLLPMFKTAVPSRAVLDSIYENLVAGEVCPTNGPVFCDYAASRAPETGRAAVVAVQEVEPEPVQESVEPSMRLWTSMAGKTVEGEYVSISGDKVILRSPQRKHIKIPMNELIPADIEYIDLSLPPKFKIDFRALSNQRQIASRTGKSDVPSVLQWQFGAKLKQESARRYPHELEVEYFAIGQQVIDRNKYILLGRGSETFIPNRENNRSHAFLSEKKVELMQFIVDSQARGRKKSGYLILVRDKRGTVIQYATSNEWLWRNLDKLNALPIGAFMDDGCNRVYPSGPTSSKY